MNSALNAPAAAPVGQRDRGLERLIHPVEPEEFEREYRDERELIVSRGDPGYFAELLNLSDMDLILTMMGAQPSLIRVVNEGRETPLADSAGGSGIAMEALFQRYRSGSTINVLYLHERWPPLSRLCRELAAELTAVVHTNVYLTPRRAQGLRPHYDTHDVFVAQIHGTKHWRLYESQRRLPPGSEPGQRVEGAKLVRELDLSPGDTMYLPRGTVHDATSAEEASLHLAIGVTPLTWGGLVRRAVDSAVARDAALREAVPAAIAGRGDWQAESQDRLAEALAKIASEVSAPLLVEQARRELLAAGPPELSGHLLDLEALPSLDLDTPVRRRDGLACSLTVDRGTACLEFAGKSVRMPERITPQLRFVAELNEFTGRDLPGALDQRGRLLLLGTLVREGFLTTGPGR